jgi:hypothetical protein
MERSPKMLWLLPALGVAVVALACGGGGGGDGEETVAASSTQVAQALLVFGASLDAAFTAVEAGSDVVFTSSVRASAAGRLDLDPKSCEGSGSADALMEWADADPDTECLEWLTIALDFTQCAPTPTQTMDGRMEMSFTGSTCEPSSVAMDFSDVAVTIPEGTVSGDFTMTTTGMTFAGDPADFDVTAATFTFDGRMQMAGSGFGTVDMDMDGLAFHFDDATATGDLNGTLTVRCNGQAFPMTMATDAPGLTLDADGNVVGGHMTVTSQGTTHAVTFNSDGSIGVTAAGGDPVDLAEPKGEDFCAL